MALLIKKSFTECKGSPTVSQVRMNTMDSPLYILRSKTVWYFLGIPIYTCTYQQVDSEHWEKS